MANKSKLVIWGASGHALVVADIIRSSREYDIVGFLDDINPDRHNTEFAGGSILGGRDKLESLRKEGTEWLLLAFGNCKARLELCKLAREKGFRLATAIHPRAVVAADVSVGSGSVICAGAVVNSNAVIRENVIINTSASVDHECIIESGAHICPGVRLAGRVVVGAATWVGIGSTVIDRVHIGAGSIIGAGSVVVNNITDNTVAYGVPAKIVRKVTPDD